VKKLGAFAGSVAAIISVGAFGVDLWQRYQISIQVRWYYALVKKGAAFSSSKWREAKAWYRDDKEKKLSKKEKLEQKNLKLEEKNAAKGLKKEKLTAKKLEKVEELAKRSEKGENQNAKELQKKWFGSWNKDSVANTSKKEGKQIEKESRKVEKVTGKTSRKNEELGAK